MILGSLCACLHGAAFPVMIIVFGEMIDLFVTNGSFGELVATLDQAGVLSHLNYTSEQVMQNPELLK